MRATAAARGLGIVTLAATLLCGLAAAAWARVGPESFAPLVKKVLPAVVNIAVTQELSTGDLLQLPPELRGTPFERQFRELLRHRHERVIGAGSGFVIDPSGIIVTANHVIGSAQQITVSLIDGTQLPARVVGNDELTDIAVIKVEPPHPLPSVRWGDSRQVEVGDWVLAAGNPFGLGGTVTSGIISARGRDIGAGPFDDFLQLDAPINPGNSGGPSFDMDGNVVGVNTAIVSPSGGSVGIAFAIPAETVKAVVAQLKEKGKVTRGWIGVQIQDLTADLAENLGLTAGRGALVAEPQPGSPAARAGIESGDVIVSVNGKEAHDSRELARTISGLPPGSTAMLVVVRRGQEKSFNVTLGNLADQREASAYHETPKQKGTGIPRLGISVARAADGVIVTSVDPGGAAADLGIASGDVILQAADKKVATAIDLRSAIEAAQKAGKRTVLMRVKSADGIKFIAVPVSGG